MNSHDVLARSLTGQSQLILATDFDHYEKGAHWDSNLHGETFTQIFSRYSDGANMGPIVGSGSVQLRRTNVEVGPRTYSKSLGFM